MGNLLVVNFKDVNGLNSNTSFWVTDLAAAEACLPHLSALSNAKIISAYMVKTLPISGIADNVAVANNNETARVKAKVRLSGSSAGGPGADRQVVTVSIPAPVGTIIDALTGAVDGLLVAPFVGKVTTHTGIETDRVDKVFYSRSH